MMGMPGLPSAQLAVSEMGLPMTGEEFLSKAKEHKQELFPHCNIMPGLINTCNYIIELILPNYLSQNPYSHVSQPLSCLSLWLQYNESHSSFIKLNWH